MIFSIAWRNVWRNKLRSLVIMLAVIFGLVGGIFSVALMNGMMEQMITSSIQTQLSNIQVHNPDYLTNNEVKYDIGDVSSVISSIKQNKEVSAISSHIKAQAMASTAATGTGVMIIGIDPGKEKKVTTIHEHLIEGSYFGDSLSRSKPILVGKDLAHKLSAGIGNKVVITIQNLENVITYGAFRIVGIFETHNSNFDKTNLFVLKKDLAELINFNPESATEIMIRLDENKQTEEVAQKLSKELQGLKVQTWMQIRPEFELFNSMTQQMLYLFLLLILFGLAFGIVNAMLMAVMERVKEIGMLMAVGMNKRRIFSMIMLETIFLSITGGIIGILGGFGLVEYFGESGIDLSVVAEGLQAVGYASTAYPSVDNSYYFIVSAMVILTAVIASIYPARKALKLKPAEAVREEA
ncbi:MAG: ABC transporter permease [Bacteroidales bacterium]|nr:ABC transporter permease [Bacteroidales bacterium]MCF8388902.1 ABC transporter permease [Bacteroidales bacterium]MCF8396937.1 ABC transporter permease [Bacteroidales bacterium]